MNWVILILVALVMIVAAASYWYFFIKRIMITFGKVTMNRKKKILLRILTIVLSLPIVNIFSLYAIIYFHLIVTTLVLELLNFGLKRFSWYRNGFTLGIYSVIIVAAILCYGKYNVNQVSETDYTLTSDKISDIRILQIADLHMSNAIDTEELEQYCQEMSELNADLVVLTGDIVDERTPLEDMIAACRLLSTIKNTKGIYYIFGNHDPATYAQHPSFHADDIRREMEKNGIVVLEDETVTVDNITIVGRLDIGINPGRLPMEQLLSGVDKNNFILVLDHQPKDLDLNAELGVDLELSGHTHGGWFFPLKEIQNLFTDILVYGERQIGDFTAITSSGISTWGHQLRTESKSEYVVIDIK